MIIQTLTQAFSILAALEGQEEVDEAAISDLPEDEEVRKEREARAKEKQKKVWRHVLRCPPR